MTERSLTTVSPDREPVEINTRVAHASRVYDYLLGGTDNFAVDREAAEHAFATYPGGVEGARTDARANRDFLSRVVRHLAADVGVRQFLDIGTGIPNQDNAHAVALEVSPDARVVYVDNDPIVLAHAHSLLDEAGDRRTAYIDGDLREPDKILEAAARRLDFSEPVAVLLIGILHVIPDEDDPYGIVRRLMDAVPSGSYLAVSQLTDDIDTEGMTVVAERIDEAMGTWNPPGFRSRAAIGRFFEGLELVGPGLIEGDRWRPDTAVPAPAGRGERATPLFCALGRKP